MKQTNFNERNRKSDTRLLVSDTSDTRLVFLLFHNVAITNEEIETLALTMKKIIE